MPTKLFLGIFLSALALEIACSVLSRYLESSGRMDRATLGASGVNAVLAASFALFLVLGFSIVPLFIRLFVHLQKKVGNGGHFLVTFLESHERGVVYGVWAVMGVAIAFIILGDRDEFLKSLK